MVSDEAVAQAEALLEGAFRAGTRDPRGTAGQAGTDLGSGTQLLASQRDPTTERSLTGTDGVPPQIRRPRDALAEFVRLHAASRLRISRATISASSRPGVFTPEDLQFANQVQNEIDWWIFWGRVAGGLNKNQQVDIFQRLSPVLLPRGSKRPRLNNSLLREMWRTAASLELLPLQTKTQLGDALLAQVKKGEMVETGSVVPVAARRAQAVLRSHQSSAAGAGGHALGGGAAKSPEIRRRCGCDRTAYGRFHARSQPGDYRELIRKRIPGSSSPSARRRSGRGSRQSVWRRAAVGVGGSLQS